MSWRRPTTLLWRLGLALAAVQVVIAILLGGYAYLSVRGFHYDRTLDELQRIASLLVARDGGAWLASDRLQELAEIDGREAGVRVTIIRGDGQVLADSDVAPGTLENHRYGRAEIESALSTGVGNATRFSQSLGESMMYFARRVEDGDGGSLIVRTALPLTTIDRQLGRLTRLMALAGAVSLAITIGLIFIVSRRLSTQVSRLSIGAARFAQGELDHRIPPSPTRELSAVAESLNGMALQLSDRIGQLEAQRNTQRAILQSMSNAVLALDTEQRIVIMNIAAERLFNVDAEASKGRLLQEVIREPELPSAARIVESAGLTLRRLDGNNMIGLW